MKIAGFLLMIAGWFLTILAVILLRTETARGVFVLAGLAVEALGLVLVFRAHPPPRSGRP
jgi:hypothetical protein